MDLEAAALSGCEIVGRPLLTYGFNAQIDGTRADEPTISVDLNADIDG